MKWVIIAMALGTAPIETGLEFDTLHECGREAAKLGDISDRAWIYWHSRSGVPFERPEGVPAQQHQAYLDNRKDRVRTAFGGQNNLICIPRANEQ
jgi:hypothetical protein